MSVSVIAVSAVAAGIFAILTASLWAVQRVAKWSYADTTCLLTGGSVGIGLETAKALARRRARHVVLAARRETVLQEAVAAVQAEASRVHSPTKVSYVVMDVADSASVRAAVAAAVAQCDGCAINLLICNAGYAHPARFMDCDMSHAKSMMDINFFGCLNVLWAVMPGMLAARRGRVVLMSSMVARAPIAGYTLYAATKAALRAFAHSLDMENSCLGVRVQVVSPPDVETPGYELEETIKSPECRAISSFGGASPFKASEMAEAVVAGITNYTFDVTLGSDGAFLSAASAAMEPATSVPALLGQILGAGPLRLVMSVFSKIHYNIVSDVRLKEEGQHNKKKDD